jgi:2-methylisocitrate lyase-like PEP mutase family enzyme
MLDEKRIRQIAQEVATANLSSANFTSIGSSTAVDSEGHEALRITIVIKPGAASKIDGDAALDTLVQIQDRLRKEGEERFPIVEYATAEELSESSDYY